MDTIHFYNPSFEGNPIEGGLTNNSIINGWADNLPRGWTDCGFRGETPPDVHPVRLGNFRVSTEPAHGRTYMGMVTRDNDTWEQIGQNLTKPLIAGKCYSFSVALARSETYFSQSRVTDKAANYVKPIKLKIYGGDDRCHKNELLSETSLIKNSKWLRYSFTISPEEDYHGITLEAFYSTPTLYPYNGNILVDDLSPIIEILCDSDSTKTETTEIDNLRQQQSRIEDSSPENLELDKNREKERLTTIKKRENKRLALERQNAAKILLQEKIQLLANQGLFESNKKEANQSSNEVLSDIVKLLKTNKSLGVQIGVKKGANRKWKIDYLRETFHANEIPKHQYDIGKFSRFVEGIWETHNDNLAVDVFKLN